MIIIIIIIIIKIAIRLIKITILIWNNNNNDNINSVNKNQIYSTYPMFIFVKLAFGGHCLHFQVYTINSMI